jgi:hypothetical protein
MNQLRVAAVSEDDFDQMIVAAGGQRCVEDASVQSSANADYKLGEALLELKLIEEEGFDKDTRRNKVAKLFRKTQPEYPVVMLDPTLLDAKSERLYFNIAAGPVQTAVKTAAKQLESTRRISSGDKIRVLVAVNNGYTALTHEEFKRVVLKSARNDTSKIDTVVVGGIYYYSDQFDSYALFRLDECPIDVSRRFHSFARLKTQWDAFSERVMTSLVRGDDPSRSFDKLPVVDIAFDIDSVSYVKPAPRIGVPSKFWTQGRPRRNSTGIEQCLPVARTFPDMDIDDWHRFREALPYSRFLLDTYADWVRFREAELAHDGDPKRPLVPVHVSYEGVLEWCQESGLPLDETQVFAYAVQIFDAAARDLIEHAKPQAPRRITPPRYIWVETHEIGQDKAYDFSMIKFVRETPAAPDVIHLVGPERIFHEHALALAAAYALKHKVDLIMYDRILTYAWI